VIVKNWGLSLEGAEVFDSGLSLLQFGLGLWCETFIDFELAIAPLPQGEFSALLFSDSSMSPGHFYLFCNLVVIEVKGHQVHFCT